LQAAPPLARYKRELEQYLRSLVSAQNPPELYQMVRYHLGWEDSKGRPGDAGGKALRSSLCLLTCEAAGGDRWQALPAAAAVELVHSFSLVHDDIQDRDAERHHRPAVWKLWGEAQGINAGDAILALAHLAVLKLAEEGVPEAAVLGAARVLSERTLEMVEGQTLDISFEDRVDVDLPGYLEMIERKSGALFDCALQLGGLVAGADASVVRRLGSVGRSLGTAFQIRDDMLGVWGDESVTGKPRGADIKRRKKSLPIVYALNETKGALRDEFRAAYAKPELTEADAERVLRDLDGTDVRQYCAELATQHKDRALADFEQLGLRPGPASELKEAAEFLLEREF
jgi:geranylgeranyl diphosphate synthase, type I